MASNDDALNINSLPEEMLIDIFSHLSQNELGRIARVCRRWNVLTKRPALWKDVNVEFHKSHESQNTVTMCFVKMLPPCVARIRLDFGHFSFWNEQLNYEEFCAVLQRRCPRLEMLILKGALLFKKLSLIIDLCTLFLQNLKILKIPHSRFSDCPSKGQLCGASKIEVLDLSGSNLGFYNMSPFSKMPYLRKLSLSNAYVDDFWFKGDISFLNQSHLLDVGDASITSSMFSVIWENGLNLKELFLCNMFVLYDLNFNYSVFSQLKTICLRGCPIVTCKTVISLIQSCQSLQNVYVDEDVAALYVAHPYIVANKCKMEIVKIISDCNEHQKDAS